MPAIELSQVPKAAVLAGLLSLGVGLGVVLAFNAPVPHERPAIEWLESPRLLSDFELQTDGGEFTNRSLEGRWTVVLFGFLHCPDVCPISLSQLAELARNLRASPGSQDVAYIFVSVDPGRDSIAEVSEYARYFDPSIRGVVGSEAQLKTFARDLGIQFKVSADDDDYDVAHSITFSIIDPTGQMLGRFRPGCAMPDLMREFALKISSSQA